MARGVLLALMAAVAACGGAWADCGSAGGVWTTMDGPLEIRAYRGEDVSTIGPYLFEGRLDGKLVWRVTGEYGCSNGISTCAVQVPMSSGDPVSASETIVEDAGRPQYVVFADLGQSVAWLRFHSAEPITVKADVFDVRALASLGDAAEIRLPNYLKFAGCSRGGGEYEPLPERRADVPPPVPAPAPRPAGTPGPFDGLWRTGAQICTVKDDDRTPVAVSGRKLKFYETECEIGEPSIGFGSTTRAEMACFGEGEEWGMSLQLAAAGDRLLIAYDGEDPREYERCPSP